ncbi:MAG: PKD domain-containing protein [Bacteroidota bacterium]
MIYSLRSYLYPLLLVLVVGLQPLAARHIIGGEMTYECLGQTPGDPTSMRYTITMTVYRDCSTDGTSQQGAGFDSDSNSPTVFTTGTITVFIGNSTIPFIETFNLGQPDVAEVLPDIGNPCLILPPNVCVQRGIYTFELDLPISTESYTISYQRCCRNESITNIFTPGAVGATYFIEITPESQQLCNTSPVFNNFPPIVLCANEPFELDMSATDADGDRLVYYLCSPVVGGGNGGTQPGQDPNAFDGVAPNPESPPPYDAVDFLAPNFTAAAPLGPGAEFMYNDSTGLLSGMPNLLGQFVVGICIDEFRGDTLLSSTKREFQFNITSCERTVFADLREDSIAPDGRFVIDICGPGEFTIINESTLEQFITSYDWAIGGNGIDTIRGTSRNLSAALDQVGTYEGTMILNRETTFNCSDTAEFFINVYPDLFPDFNFAYDTCVAGPVAFTDLSVADDPAGIDQWSWNFGDASTGATSQNPNHLYTQPGDFNVGLTITDFNNCSASISKPVNYFPAPPLIIISPSASDGCEPHEVLFTNLSTPIDETYDIIWEFGDGGTSMEISPTYTYEDVGQYDVYIAITSPIGCFIDTLFPNLITVDPAPTAGFSFSPTMPSNLQRDVFFEDESLDAIAWQYDIGDQFSTPLRNFSYTFRDTGMVAITQYVTHPSGCIDSLTQFIDIEPVITFHMPNAFSPNGDGLNDILFPKSFLFGYRDYRFTVWNRWGQRIFATNDPDEGWDGRFNGRDSPGGAYLWEAEIIGPRGKSFAYKGTATLIR